MNIQSDIFDAEMLVSSRGGFRQGLTQLASLPLKLEISFLIKTFLMGFTLDIDNVLDIIICI